jgi:hypothetical protein
MMLRPSTMNMHEFVAEENSCFFDICLPNYATETLRKLTYYKVIEDVDAAVADLSGKPPLLKI